MKSILVVFNRIVLKFYNKKILKTLFEIVKFFFKILLLRLSSIKVII